MTSIAFNLPRTVTLAADAALLGLAGLHAYLLATAVHRPGYFAVYCVAMIIGCVIAAGITWIDVDDIVPAAGWKAGGILCTAFMIGYPISRMVRLPGLSALTGRWDLAPGNLALACAAAFLGLYLTVLFGVNVAFGQRRGWYD
ncbi:oxidoreductase [Mycolicibacter heraklionensis]|uniref:Oxidoreductase n=1 Tax=Mycolicibacter heraklionensis TaxID=512402 RepID=A0AA91IZC9_9MYCO|nr:oxidoreductase [Mycolicibacter heraklionensis]OBK88625.1 oxidoreductase [Mycolicibacter heraklionensis]